MNEVPAKPRRRDSVASQDGPNLRTWLDELDAAGQLARVTAKVDWEEEIGAIARANLAQGGLPEIRVRLPVPTSLIQLSR